MEIDLTGNWSEMEGFRSAIQAREPPLKENESRVFHQAFTLPSDGCWLRMDYYRDEDVKPDRAICSNKYVFGNCWVNGERRLLTFYNKTDNVKRRPVRHIVCALDGMKKGDTVTLRWEWFQNRPPCTKLIANAFDDRPSTYQGVQPAGQGKLLVAHGIPFLARDILDFVSSYDTGMDTITPKFQEPERGEVVPWMDGVALDCAGVRAKKAHFLGMIHATDVGNGGWYINNGDHGFAHFAGDKAGEIVLNWADGGASVIPLIFGFNLWFSRPWDVLFTELAEHYPVMFGGHHENLDVLAEALGLVDGIRPMNASSVNTRFIFSVELPEARPLRAIHLKGDRSLHGHPLISAITFETGAPVAGLPVLPAIAAWPANSKAISLAAIEQKTYAADIERIKRLLYTHRDQLPKLSSPEIPRGYFGPGYDFQGTPEAVYAASFLYRNGPESGSHIADSGMITMSPVSPGITAYYYDGTGIWFNRPAHYGNLENWFEKYRSGKPGSFPGLGFAWGRGIGQLMREAAAFGYDKYLGTYTDWLDKCLFADAKPPHWVRCPGAQEGCYSVRVGDQVESGVRENDAHGLCMIGRYAYWRWLGAAQGAAWNERHFDATCASVDWIQWMLDTDLIRPGQRKDVLYAEGECVYGGGYEIFSSYACLQGVKLAIRMAQALGRTDKVETWSALYSRLRQGILDHLVDDSPFGPIWHVAEQSWPTRAHMLAHIFLATEYDTYTPLRDYAADPVERRYLEISRNSYRYMMRNRCCDLLRAYGYGQGMMAQSALLLDEMQDAERFINLMVSCGYLPHLSGWAAPEGIVLHRSGEYWLPINAYAGHDSHLADSVKAVRLMLGLDDNQPEHLRLVPRFPASWDRISISDYPVLTGAARQKISYKYARNRDGQAFEFTLDRRVEELSVRLGPLPGGRVPAEARWNGKKHPLLREKSGDSEWVWLSAAGVKEGRLEVVFR